MTVGSSTAKVTGVGNGSATVFSFSPVVIFVATNLIVTKITISTGVEELLVEGTGPAKYSIAPVTFPASGATGSVTFPEDEVTPMTSDEKIVMQRVLPLAQPTDLQNQSAYFPETLET